jgi:uncharacterized GH25 family protein
MCRLSILLLLGLPIPARAHDLWLIPPEKATPKQAVRVEASVGMDFPISTFAADTARYPLKFVVQPDGKTLDLKSAGKKDLVSFLEFEPAIPGIHRIAVETTPKIIELEADKFNEYLITDGMPHIFRLRAREKILNKPAVERYRKSPIALVQVGDGQAGEWNKPIGVPLEIVPMQNPFERKIGDTLRVRVVFKDKALPNANLGWHRPGDGDTPIGSIRTDDKGEALIPIAKTGLMTIRLTHMTRPMTPEYEWESFWTTLTFRIP